MEDKQLFTELEELLLELSIKIKYGRGYFIGGLCRYKEDKYIYLNRSDDKDKHISIILSELENIDLSGIKLNKTIGELLSKSDA
jgi:retron-type reverse transcriptase